MQVILTGATGLVGSATLSHILSLTPSAASTQHISRVSILSRNPDIPLLTHPNRPTTNTHTTVEVIPHADFNIYPAQLLSTLKSHSGPDTSPVAVIWALGMSQNDATSAEQYTRVTKTYAVSAAQAFAEAFKPQRVNFVYVSGEGATTSPGRFTPLFGRVKGETERELTELTARDEYANLRVYNVRPGGVDPGDRLGGQDAVNQIWEEKQRKTGGWAYSVAKAVLLPVMRAGMLGRGMHSPTAEVGRVLVGLGVGDGRALSGSGIEEGGWTVRNVGLRRLAREME